MRGSKSRSLPSDSRRCEKKHQQEMEDLTYLPANLPWRPRKSDHEWRCILCIMGIFQCHVSFFEVYHMPAYIWNTWNIWKNHLVSCFTMFHTSPHCSYPFLNEYYIWLVVEPPSCKKYARQIGSFPQVGVKMKNVWSHLLPSLDVFQTSSESHPCIMATLSAASPPGSFLGFAGGFGNSNALARMSLTTLRQEAKNKQTTEMKSRSSIMEPAKICLSVFSPKKNTKTTQFDVWSLWV